MKNLFIGIDFSKRKFDVSVFQADNLKTVHHDVFSNDTDGYISMLNWISSLTEIPEGEWLFCGENTGVYSIGLTRFLISRELFMWLENPYQIKCSTGIKREKNDKVDSYEIAMYAYRFRDKARAYRIKGRTIESLGLLLTYRQKLVKEKTSLLVSVSELRRSGANEGTISFIYEDSKKQIEELQNSIKAVEKKMLELIKDNEPVCRNYQLALSVKGIALVNIVALLVITDNFTRFQTARELACYCGVVPFEKSSGSSFDKGKHISHIADKQMKALLTQAARCAIIYDKNLKEYYQRKKKEGKKERVVINNVRNKLLHIVFAVVMKEQVYDENYSSDLKEAS